MPDDKFMNVLDYAAFGDIIKKWSHGTVAPPPTIADFRAQVPSSVVEIGPGYADTDAIHYAVLPPSSDQVSFIIPHEDDIDFQMPSGAWPLPDFYSELAFNDEPVSVADSDKDVFKSSRIADYSSTKCM